MSTKPCKDCQADIPKKAKKCQHCGTKQGTSTFVKVILSIMFIGFLGSFLPDENGSRSSTSTAKSSTPTRSSQPYIENDSLFCVSEDALDTQTKILVSGRQVFSQGCGATGVDIDVILKSGGGLGVTKAVGIDNNSIYWVHSESIKYK